MKKIRITTGDEPVVAGDDLRSRGAFSDFFGQLKTSSLEIDAAALTRDLKEVYTTMADSLCELQDAHPGMAIESIEFTLGIDTTGQVSLLSAVSGSNVTRTGITFQLSFKAR